METVEIDTVKSESSGLFIPTNYRQIRRLIRSSKRRPKVLKQDGTVGVARAHDLTNEQVEERLKRWRESGEFVSPYTNGVYTHTLLAMWQLGANRAHNVLAILEAVKPMMMQLPGLNGLTEWERYTKPSSAKNSLDPYEKIWQNARQFVRYGGGNPYGFKLTQIGCVVDRFIIGRGKYIRLNTYAFRGYDRHRDPKVVKPLYMKLAGVDEIPPVDIRKEYTLGPHPQKG